jgi:hypothetical protein
MGYTLPTGHLMHFFYWQILLGKDTRFLYVVWSLYQKIKKDDSKNLLHIWFIPKLGF